MGACQRAQHPLQHGRVDAGRRSEPAAAPRAVAQQVGQAERCGDVDGLRHLIAVLKEGSPNTEGMCESSRGECKQELNRTQEATNQPSLQALGYLAGRARELIETTALTESRMSNGQL